MRKEDVIRLGLAVATAVVYFQVTSFGFVNLDDPGYISTNDRVQAGLSWDNLRWAFTSLTFSNWHPLTWLSYMLDCQVFGLNPYASHLINLLFHILNTMLLFTVLLQMAGGVWRCAFVAALFALHPLHVESVAWVAERKDVLSTFFWLLAMGYYTRYVQAPSLARYSLVAVCFVLGLLAKPMVVTLPCVLLLLDYWPLRRKGWKVLVAEKIPLFALAALSCVLTYVAQQRGGAMDKLDCPFFSMRIPNALLSYNTYILKMFWPAHLIIPYPHPGFHIRSVEVIAAASLLAVVTAFSLWRARRSPYLIVGWLWYLGTLVPVIGLVQVGLQAMADRYTYVPLIGLFVMIAWGMAEVVERIPRCRTFVGVAAGMVIGVLSVCTWCQVGYWRDSFALFTHTLSVTPENLLAETTIGHAFLASGRLAEAEQHLRNACRLDPDYSVARINLGTALIRQGKLEQAAELFSRYLERNPDDVTSLAGMARVYQEQNLNEKAIVTLERILSLAPHEVGVVVELSSLLIREGRYEEAEAHCRDAVAHAPYDEGLRANLDTVLAIRSRPKT